MRSSIAEWLLLSLLLFPLLAGAGFCLYARQDYLNRTERYRTDAVSVIRGWQAGGLDTPLGEIRHDFVTLCGRLEDSGALDGMPTYDRDEYGPDAGTLWCPDSAQVGGPWKVTTIYPAGLSPETIADPSVRMKIETGVATGDLDGVDEATRAFRRMSERQDLEALRAAALPPSTKLYLVRRWGPEYVDAERQLVLLAAYLRALENYYGWMPHGFHDFGDLRVASTKGSVTTLLLPPGEGPESLVQFTSTMPVGEFARLSFGTTAPLAEQPHTVWRDRLEEPLAGEWSLSLTYGDAWWRAPFFSRWWALVAAGMIALILPPGLLFVSVRRRRKLDEARARFINEIAHDLRTPLTSLRLYSEMLASERTPEENRGGYVDVIARESTRVSGLLANLLDLSRLERGERKLIEERVDLDAATEAALADFTALYPARAEDVRVTGPDGAFARADRTALGRVLANLLDNAGKFTAKGTPIRIAWGDSETGRICLTVSDEGPGIPVSERRRIFARYERGSAADDAVQGTGLGLSLVRELTEAMGGTARLANSERGASFMIDLPGGVDG